jgi:hypothetical protein
MHAEVQRALRMRAVALNVGVLLLLALAATLLTKEWWAAISVIALTLLFAYAVVWGTRMRVDLAGRAAADDTVREVLRALPKSAQVRRSKNSRALIRFPVDPKAAIRVHHDIRLDWRRNQVRVEAESPSLGELSRTLLLRRADAWRTVVAEFESRGYAPGR